MGKKSKKKMTLVEYTKFVTGLASPKSMKSFESRLATGGLGIAGEAGEVSDMVKKILFHGKKFDDEVKEYLIKELGDVLWYVVFMADNVVGVSVQDLIDINVEKLKDRYNEGKFTEKAFLDKEAKKAVKKLKKAKTKIRQLPTEYKL